MIQIAVNEGDMIQSKFIHNIQIHAIRQTSLSKCNMALFYKIVSIKKHEFNCTCLNDFKNYVNYCMKIIDI